MAGVMMALGAYRFSISTAAYQEMSRAAEYRWAAQERVGAGDALQFTGAGPETIEIAGVIFPHYRGGLGQLESMRLQASLGVPLPLISGTGRMLGLWAVESVREDQRIFARRGAPLRVEFSLRLRRYDGGLRALLPF